MKQWYESLFANFGNKYEEECYVKGTVGECNFIETEIDFNKSFGILDIGCGTGRHSIELAKRGYDLTGVDLSDSMLNKAREKAKAAEVFSRLKLEKHDARNLPFHRDFDLAIMLCEGSFPLMETDEMNFEILKNARNAIRETGSKLIFTTLNGLFPLYHSVKDFLDSQKADGNMGQGKSTFDLMTFRDHNVVKVIDDSGIEKEYRCNERYYVPSEITWMLKCLGFKKIDIYGAKLGAFSRNDKLTTEDFEMLVIAES
jgi:SAM-dependent methyltransferase